jgi:hypothetical protein
MKASTGSPRQRESFGAVIGLPQDFRCADLPPDVTNVPVLQTMEKQPGSWRQRGREILQIQQPEHEQSA